VIVARETRENRTQLQRLQMETVQLPGLTAAELTEVSNLARNVFDAQQSAAEPSTGTLTVRAPGKTLEAFNQTVTRLIQGRAQLDLDVKIIQVALVHNRETGTTFFQQTGVYNAYSEINSVIQQNQSAVQQIIAAGLVPNDTTLNNQLTIIGILLAAGTLTGPPFNQGLIGFGNGITGSILAVSPATLTMTLNSSDTRELDDVHLSLADQEDGTIKTGERYPIESSSYSSVAIAAAATAGLSSQTIPQIQYEDLGLTLKATPKIMRSGDIALKFSLKIEALGGSSLNDIPVLDNRSMEGVLTLREGDTAVLLSDLTRQESRALSGLPGVSDIPGLQEISDIQKDQSYSRLLIMVTPSVTRETNQGSHSPIFMVDKSTTSR
jgi:type II secretory pathway component GspD/PulD (secretin)